MDMVTCELWVIVGDDGSWDVAKNKDDLRAEAGECSRFVKVTVNVPRPKPVELVATVASEPTACELKAA